ncbi:MAG: histidine kinase dimerization/phospho-acceptor domain-containing protein [Bacteroides sp.]|uniref:sensor histidine kinase n=1 Tax=Bacteroides sp. TaxID=29523 RepID=UPI0026DF7620|nr:hybrid sensor histidine kinase/response regulator [Bacteroides sp.]MDO5421660.1 histidine kinase dimerization/phospho-acceptor domain-containing protein [Bacteroides sp.]
MKQIFTLLIALCWLLPSAHADVRRAEVKDSLLRIYLASPADTTRLRTLYQIALLDQLSPTFIYYENKLLEEAIAQKNVHYQSAAIYAHIIYYYNLLDQKHAEQWLRRLEQLSEKHNYYCHYFRGKKLVIEFYIISQKIELALKQAQDMYDKAQSIGNQDGMREACLCLMTGYFNTLRYKEGITYLNKAFELTNPDSSLATQIDLLTKAVLAYSYLHDNDNMFRYLEELNNAKNRLQKESTTVLTNGYTNLYLLIDLQYALYYTRLQRPAEAWEYLQKSERYLSTSSFLPYRLIRLAAYAEYYQLTKEYDKALVYLEDAIELVTPISPDDAMIYGLQKADILVKMGFPDNALPIYNQITKARDSLYTVFSTSQIEQIQSLYNMDQLLFQKEQRQATFHRICLVTSITIIIALLLFNLHMYRSRKRLQQDEKEMRKLVIIAEEANEIKSRFLANMSYNIRIPLNNVVGFSQLLSTDNELDEEERKEYSGIIQANSGELIQLVNDVLDLSRLEANMMKFQLQDCNVKEWCNELGCLIQMRSEGRILLELQVEVGDVRIHTDVNRLTQIVTSMLLYPNECKETRKVSMFLVNHPDKHIIACRIENSPIADSRFASQKVSVQQKINQLFFEHFKGTYQTENVEEGEIAVITFTYPTLS